MHEAPTGAGVGSRSSGTAWPVLAFVAVVSLAACGGNADDTPPEDPGPVTSEPVAGAPVPGALYHTELTFVGRGQPPALLHLRFDNETDSVALRLRYRGWFAGDEWNPVLEHRDSLPIPRAAWRVLPTGPLRILVGEGGEPVSVILEHTGGTLRLDSWGAIGSWNSSTGQRESLRLAELLEGSGGESGLLLLRQRAHRIEEPVSEGIAQYFLVSDTLGNAVLLMRDSTVPDAPVTAWTWFQDVEAEWGDALILTLAAPAGSPGRWSFELPEAGLIGELRGAHPHWNELPAEQAGFEAFRVEGTLVLEGEPWIVSGIGLQERGP